MNGKRCPWVWWMMYPEKPLGEGEYCLVELSPTQNQYTPTVWDFSIVK